jgi:hypothetical protein
MEKKNYIQLFLRGEPAEKWPHGTLVKVEIAMKKERMKICYRNMD